MKLLASRVLAACIIMAGFALTPPAAADDGPEECEDFRDSAAYEPCALAIFLVENLFCRDEQGNPVIPCGICYGITYGEGLGTIPPVPQLVYLYTDGVGVAFFGWDPESQTAPQPGWGQFYAKWRESPNIGECI